MLMLWQLNSVEQPLQFEFEIKTWQIFDRNATQFVNFLSHMENNTNHK